jgi:hypothetical protein
MLRLTDVTGLASGAIVVAAILVALARLRHRHAWGLVAALVVAFVPLGTLSLVGYLRGVIGDLSLPTTLLLLRGLLRPVFDWKPIDARSRLALQALAATGGLALYPLTLRSGSLDPYRLGYADHWFLGALFLLALGAWFCQLYWVALSLALTVFAWALGYCESRNLWDYLLDPFLAAWGLGALFLRALKMRASTSGPSGRGFESP